MKAITHNFWLKLVALILGLLIWLHVATEKTYDYTLSLPVTEIMLGESLVPVEEPLDSVEVSVAASGKQLLRRRWREQGIRINALGLDPGEHRLELSRANCFLVSRSQNVALEDILLPTHILLTVDVLDKAVVQVEPDLTLEANEGFAISQDVTVSPSRVTLHGPRSSLRGVRSISTVHRDLNGLRDGLEIALPLRLPSEHGFRAEPDTVVVTIDVVPVKTRIYENIPVVVFNSPSDREVGVDPPYVRVELSGPPEDIDLLNRNALTVSVDFRRRDEAGRAPLEVDCPAHFRVRKTSVDSVTVSEVAVGADSRN